MKILEGPPTDLKDQADAGQEDESTDKKQL